MSAPSFPDLPGTDTGRFHSLDLMSTLVAVLRATTPILFAALGGLVSDLAGSINVALEGLMLVAAFFGVMGAVYAGQWLPGLSPWACAWPGDSGFAGAAGGAARPVVAATASMIAAVRKIGELVARNMRCRRR